MEKFKQKKLRKRKAKNGGGGGGYKRTCKMSVQSSIQCHLGRNSM
jgi:hypothetical protein